jgi:hypothetical protein
LSWTIPSFEFLSKVAASFAFEAFELLYFNRLGIWMRQ